MFPTPYPDEILYSVICRYHVRCGSPAATQTNHELWGKRYGKKLFLPDGIDGIAAQIPIGAALTAERLINENTIYPALKPFLTKEKNTALIDAMKLGHRNIYNIVSFSGVFTLQHRFLRYCAECVGYDIKTYGEPYWHRTHQMPGVFFCPTHRVPTFDSTAELNDLSNEYYPAALLQNNSTHLFKPDVAEALLAFANDTGWLLRYGSKLGHSGYTAELYDNWLRVKKYRDYNGKTSSKKLAQDISSNYGKAFLAMFGAYNSGACAWIEGIVQRKKAFQHPLYHLLLIHFLGGSAEAFFEGSGVSPPKYLPFGMPPYPCRNYACECHLHDVIMEAEIIKVHGLPSATFKCPYCGFSYRRKKRVPKEKQYVGRIRVVDYGRKWEESVTMQLLDGKSPDKIARNVHCGMRTVIAFGVEHALLPPDLLVERNLNTIAAPQRPKPDFNVRRDRYRQRWLALTIEAPDATRTELTRLDSSCYRWLIKNDADWLGLNMPRSQKTVPTWIGSDDEYLGRIESAVKRMRGSPGKPVWISVSAIGKKAGIINPHTRLASNLLPKTRAFVAANVESFEQWQERKILWAIQQLCGHDETLTVNKVRHAACITDKERKFDGFILECIANNAQ